MTRGRLLRYITRSDGLSLQVAQLRRGVAEVYVYQGRPFQRVDEFKRAEAQARAHGRGTWGKCGDDFHTPKKGAQR